ncbi:SIMPL domain-containing protein [Lacipirellula sp.]|uniref:SIMPL domain-containing protein n=1 Tax=Lacipirellula sp. TaxID=2691419 RepID=UPI003D0AB959
MSVDLRQPVFDSESNIQSFALSAAYDDARTKAESLAKQMGVILGDVLRVEEGPWSQRRSGFGGDYDWNGDGGRFGVIMGAPAAVAGSASVGGDEFSPANPSRDIWVKCKVRFGIRN